MGSGSSKTTNRMLAEQTRRANAIGDVAGGRSAEIYKAGRGDIDFARQQFMNMLSGLGEEGAGGGGGGGYTPVEFESSTLPFYLEMMRTGGGLGEAADFYRKLMSEGGYDEATRSAIESAGSAPIASAFEGLKRNLNTMAAGRGTGYASGLGMLARDKAYAMGDMGKQVMADLADRILASKERGAAGITGLEEGVHGRKFAGAGGATGIESEKRAFEAAERDRAAAAARAGAAGRYDDLDTRRRLVYDILGLEGDKDLAYMDRQLGAGGLGLGTVTGRVDETPLWQKSVASVLPAAASSAIGAFVPTPKVKRPQAVSSPTNIIGTLDQSVW